MSDRRSIYDRVRSRYQRSASERLARRSLVIKSTQPIISFTFDDFPKSAFEVAGRILEQHGIRGTYYASLGLMGQSAPTGKIFEKQDLIKLIKAGHEVGCHTFAHCSAAETPPSLFEQSVLENAHALKAIAPGLTFKTHSYPIGSPKPETKRRCAKYFANCRGGGQTYNAEMIDLNRLNAYFLEQSRDLPSRIEEVISENCRAGGWLILATHDVCEEPTRFGCKPELFQQVVRWAKESAADILTVSNAFEKLQS